MRRDPGEKISREKFTIIHMAWSMVLPVGFACFHAYLSTKAILIILPSVHSLSPDNAIESERRNRVKT